jgi:hypothetical protein
MKRLRQPLLWAAQYWYAVPPILRRTHLSWWAAFITAILIGREWYAAVSIAALVALLMFSLLFFFDRQ